MRALFLVAVIGVFLTPQAAAWPDSAAVALYREDTVLLSWTPVTAANFYVIYRGASWSTLEKIAVTEAPLFLDTSPSRDLAHYVVAWEGADGSGLVWSTSGSHTGCVRLYDGLRFSLNVQNCLAR